MGYQNGKEILPAVLVEQIQEYVDGVNIYIPRKEENKKEWGETTDTRMLLKIRNKEIYQKYQSGVRVTDLAEAYHISPQAIYKILAKQQKK